MIGFGTAWCLRRQKQPDSIVYDNAIIHIPICMIQTIEVRDQLCVKDYHAYTCFYAIIDPLLDIVHCPRSTVKFFHRRNPCHCLHEIYYTLKETTERTALCFRCGSIAPIKQMYRCRCKSIRYCSRECAVEDWPYHKDNCE